MIRLTNLDRMHLHLSDDLYEAVNPVIASGQAVLGPELQKLEEKIASYSSARFCAVVGSGSDALQYILAGLELDTVQIPAQTYIATANSAKRAGCKINYVDVDATGQAVFDNTGAKVYVGLFGNVGNIDKDTIEDGAQHFGAPLQGIAAAYSFDPTKTLPNWGNGGAVVSNSLELIEKVKHYRRHGYDNFVGGNSVISERDCAELVVKLEWADTLKQRRIQLAEYYTESLQEYVDIITDLKGQISKFVIATTSAKCLQRYLSEKDIQSKLVYEKSLADLRQATLNCRSFLSIPCEGYTTWEEAGLVVDAIKMFFEPSPLKT